MLKKNLFLLVVLSLVLISFAAVCYADVSGVSYSAYVVWHQDEGAQTPSWPHYHAYAESRPSNSLNPVEHQLRLDVIENDSWVYTNTVSSSGGYASDEYESEFRIASETDVSASACTFEP